VAESQKLRRLTIHALRHSFASILLMGGTPDAEVSAQLGHADVYTTKKFTAISYRRWATDAAARLGSLLLKSKPEPKAGSGVDF
jgi:site-specific recombinase XerD